MSTRAKLLNLIMALAGAALILLAVGPAGAMAKSEIVSFSNTPSTTQAGAHPTVVTAYEVTTHETTSPPPCECNDPKDIHIHTPAGLVANPHVVSVCSAADFANRACSGDSQVGLVTFKIGSWFTVPLYREDPQAGQAGLFAFSLPLATPVAFYIAVNARTGGDYGLDFRLDGLNHGAAPNAVTTIFWGVPGARSHDPLRFSPGEQSIECDSNPLAVMLEDVVPADCSAVSTEEDGTVFVEPKKPVRSSLSPEPFTQNPTTCAGPLTSTMDVLAYDGEATHAAAPWPATTGCDTLSFNPSLAAAPTTGETDSASGLAVDLKVPQFEDPEVPSPSELRATTITLPEGFSINPSAADGKLSCTDQQANFTNEEAAQCPEYSKVGSTVLESSALPGPIPGYIYLGEPEPGDRYRIILTASGYGTNVKLLGSVRPDPRTGQLVTSFENLPQAPFQDFDLHFFGSERGLLATPTQCGTYPVRANFTPWASELSDQSSTQFFRLQSGPEGKPCPNGARSFSPSFAAGVENNTGGAFSPFLLQLSRQDGDQFLTGLTVKTPPGFSAKLRGVPYCPEEAIARLTALGSTGVAEEASPACPAASQIGTVIAGAGAGTHPVYLYGKAYLAGPYQGAPLSMLVVLPAVSGPYDLGNVAVRVALHVDETTAQITAISDPLPQILEGIPLRTRFLRVDLNRSGFALNPTNCDPFSVQATVLGDEGASDVPSAPFQVSNCADLSFAPRFEIRTKGSTKRTGNPSLTTTITTAAGEANFSSARVVLPHSQFIDNAHIGTPCTRVQFAAGACPAGSVIGHAKATSPLLANPLEGPVYIRSSSHKLPDLVADLRGQIRIVLDARVDQVRHRTRTTFQGLPDVPVGSFSLTVFGGRHGILENSEDLCRKAQRTKVTFGGQNGRQARSNPKIEVAGCRARPRHRRHAKHHRAGSSPKGGRR